MGFKNYRDAATALEGVLGPLLNPLDRWGFPVMSAKDRMVAEERTSRGNTAGNRIATSASRLDKHGQSTPQYVHGLIPPSCIAVENAPIRSALKNRKLWANWNNVAEYDCTDEYGNTERITGTRSGIDFGANSPEDVVPYNSEALTKHSKPIPGWGDYPRITTIKPRPFHPMESDVEELKRWYRDRMRSSGP